MRKLFRGLHWKLTLSYTVVTVVTLLAVEVLLIAGISFLMINANVLPGLLISTVDIFIAPQIAAYLDQPEPDIESLRAWLDKAYAEGITFHSSQNPSLSIQLGDLDQTTALIVLDQNLDPLVSMPGTDQNTLEGIIATADDLLAAAQQGERDTGLVSKIADGFLTIAVPVMGVDGRSLGVIVMVITYPPSGSLPQVFSLVGVSLIIFTLATGLIGTVFGFITTRGFTKRLRSVSRAAGSWSQGDFSAFIRDRSSDELGQTAQQLNRMAEQLQNLLQTRQELAALEERNRLARDLHDSVKQQVFATSMQLGALRASLDPHAEDALAHLDEAQKLTAQAQAELETLIRELRPDTLQGKTLSLALSEALADWSHLNHIEAAFNVQGEGIPSLEVEQALFRITQEALANIARHSQAAHVELRLVLGKEALSLSISDDGKGFNPASVEGVGLQSMHERMQAVGGSLDIESSPGKGASITAHCPLKKEVSHE